MLAHGPKKVASRESDLSETNHTGDARTNLQRLQSQNNTDQSDHGRSSELVVEEHFHVTVDYSGNPVALYRETAPAQRAVDSEAENRVAGVWMDVPLLVRDTDD